jgi:murein DD-endopeptidase MepM/ murein hydrolase activator NlpD
MAATTTSVDRSVTVEEGDRARIYIEREGDLATYSTVWVTVVFSDRDESWGDLSFRRVGGDGVSWFNQNQNQGAINFAPGDDRAYVEFDITEDGQAEDYESFGIEIYNPTNTNIGDSRDFIKVPEHDTAPNTNLPLVRVDDAVAALEGTGQELEWKITYTNPYNRDWDGSEDGRTVVHYQIINDRTGQVVDSGSTTNSNVDAYEVETRTIDYRPPDDNVYTGGTTYTFRVTRLEYLSGQTGNVASGLVVDDELPYVPPIPPEISIRGDTVDEGEVANVELRLNKASASDVSVVVSTYYGTFNEANTGGSGLDYAGLVDRSFTIPAGDTSVTVPITTFTDNIYNEGDERFEVRIESASGATIDDESATVRIRDTTVEPEPVPDPVLSGSQVFEYNLALTSAESIMGTNRLVSVIESEPLLLRLAKTLQDAGSNVIDGLVQAGLSLIGTTAYAAEADVPPVQSFNSMADEWYEFLFPSSSYGRLLASLPDYYTSWDLAVRDVELRVGDYVDDRLVIGQPLFSEDGLEVDAGGRTIYSSLQGRYDAVDRMTSHFSNDGHAFDWGGRITGNNDAFVLAPIGAWVVHAVDHYVNDPTNNGWGSDSNKNDNGGFGNVVTIRVAHPNGADVDITFAHLKKGSVPDAFLKATEANPVEVDQYQILGLMGNTGAGDKHLHMQVGNGIENGIAVIPSEDIESKLNLNPPVYMLGFGNADIASRAELKGDTSLAQDAGFPAGDSRGSEPNVVSGIQSTVDYDDFRAINDAYFNPPPQGPRQIITTEYDATTIGSIAERGGWTDILDGNASRVKVHDQDNELRYKRTDIEASARTDERHESRVLVTEFVVDLADGVDLIGGELELTLGKRIKLDASGLDQVSLAVIAAEIGDDLDRADRDTFDFINPLSNQVGVDENWRRGDTVSFTLNEAGLTHLAAGGELAVATSYHFDSTTPPNDRNGRWDELRIQIDDADLELELQLPINGADEFLF